MQHEDFEEALKDWLQQSEVTLDLFGQKILTHAVDFSRVEELRDGMWSLQVPKLYWMYTRSFLFEKKCANKLLESANNWSN